MKKIVIAWMGLMVGVQADLVNGGFEDSVIVGNYQVLDPVNVLGWSVSTSDQGIEIWTSGFNGVEAFEGTQFAELNSTEPAAYYQDLSDAGVGTLINWSFAHRARENNGSARNDTVQLTITDLGGDNDIGGGDDSVLFDQSFTSGSATWSTYSSINYGGALTAVSDNNVRVEWRAIEGATASIGNFLDGASVTVFEAVPEPVSISLIGGSGLTFLIIRRFFG